MGSFGLPELLVIFLIVLLLFGGSRIKDVGRSLGEGIREFKKAMSGSSDKKDNEEKK
ncbi:MAG: twin-arginine translocase TatA/TatE family subunit [Candidatus Omnitrophica bacterium CG07_land_8_20_14_0_80_50_8]|nr:MAG: Sec-independent protein translocase TatA [Candidatus Omnitrophica bacterium CG1_02_49_16]PIU40219.1 MAG: twin-arginine translocase TatA/TatE family subunit [Candidatus Omnitrophica bacterium CG07_land_8_20_14_0_80_50_8]